jgi:MFS family permease
LNVPVAVITDATLPVLVTANARMTLMTLLSNATSHAFLCVVITSETAGYVFGFLQALAPTITSELFGLAHFATNAAFISTMFIAASFGIASALTGYLYKANIAPGMSECFGRECFQLSFLTCAAISAIATACSVVLTVRRRKFYRRIARCALTHLINCFAWRVQRPPDKG